MLKRFFRLREFISADDEDLADYLSSRTAHRNLASLLDSLRDVESVSKRLQADGLTLLDARNLCDGLIEIRPSFAKYLGTYIKYAEGLIWECGFNMLVMCCVSLFTYKHRMLKLYTRLISSRQW